VYENISTSVILEVRCEFALCFVNNVIIVCALGNPISLFIRKIIMICRKVSA
jgi:hypothetical protein